MLDGPELKPCPNVACKSSDVELYRFMQPAAGNEKHVVCGRCGMHGPSATPANAALLWNLIPREPGRPRYEVIQLSKHDVAEILSRNNHDACSRWKAVGDRAVATPGSRLIPLEVAELMARSYLLEEKEAADA